jgi:hypothetical protein
VINCKHEATAEPVSDTNPGRFVAEAFASAERFQRGVPMASGEAFDSSEGRFFSHFTFRHPGSPVLDKKDKKRRIDIEESAFVFVATYADPLGASEFGSSLFAALF